MIAKQPLYLLEGLRPKQWIKNTFIFAGIIFSGKLFVQEILSDVILGFLLFSLGSGSIYLLNDLKDMEKDRLHPKKCKRPLPSGRLNPRFALFSAIMIMVITIPISFYLNKGFCLLLLTYLVMNISYSLKLQDIVIIDVMIIATGFVIRVLAGTYLALASPSDWLIICTITLSLFLGFSKRRHELIIAEENPQSIRNVLEHYNIQFLDQMIATVTAATLISYILYTLSQETIAKFETRNLIFTFPFVLYGIFRYLYLIHQKDGGGDASNTFFEDIPFLINGLLWGLAVLIIIYRR